MKILIVPFLLSLILVPEISCSRTADTGASTPGVDLESDTGTHSRPSPTGFLERSITVEGTDFKYQIYVPREYTPDTRWPVILFLHGAGERGSDGVRQTEVGLGAAIRTNPDRWPAIVVFPQVPENRSFVGLPGDVAMAALDATIAAYSTDSSRVYLTGLSMGGNGTWVLGYEHPDRFAALAPICSFIYLGGRFGSFIPDSTTDPYAKVASRVGSIPIWIFHGDADPVVPVTEARKLNAALKAAGADVQYTEFPGVGHNAWDPAYAMPELAEWMFEQVKR